MNVSENRLVLRDLQKKADFIWHMLGLAATLPDRGIAQSYLRACLKKKAELVKLVERHVGQLEEDIKALRPVDPGQALKEEINCSRMKLIRNEIHEIEGFFFDVSKKHGVDW